MASAARRSSADGSCTGVGSRAGGDNDKDAKELEPEYPRYATICHKEGY